MLKKFLTPLLALAMLASSVQGLAQSRISPTLITTQNGEQAIQLQNLKIHSEVRGSMAETTVEMTFYNPNSRVLEGNLQFPLQSGQQITGFELDINGKMRAAVPVEKAKGRQVFEEIQRRGVDPALLEMTQGNNFKLRVYPIMPHSTRTVRLTTMEVFKRRDQAWEMPLIIPYLGQANKSSITIHAQAYTAEPQVLGASTSLRFKADGDGYTLSAENPVFAPSAAISILLPQTHTALAYVREFQGDDYFYAEVPFNAQPQNRSLPTSVGLLWDASGSGAARDIESELNLLDLYFKAASEIEVRLQMLRDRAEPVQSFKIKNGQWSTLRKVLSEAVYDGASALANWKPDADVGEYLFFSDGLMNYGHQQFPALKKEQRLFTINSASSNDNNRLRALAERHGGRLIEVNRNSLTLASKQLLTESVRVLDAKGKHLSQIHFESMAPDGDVIRLAGKLLASEATLQLQLLVNGKRQKIDLAIASGGITHPLASYLWANYRLRSLEADRDNKRAEIRRLGMKFSIPSTETSLIVLEELNDYIKFDITPPEELLQDFKKYKEYQTQQSNGQLRHQVDQLVRQFQERIQWWNTDFSKRNISNIKEEKKPSPPPLPMYEERPPMKSDNVQEVIINGYKIKKSIGETSMPMSTINSAEKRQHVVVMASSFAPAEPAPVAVAPIAPVMSRMASTSHDQYTSTDNTNSNIAISLKKWTSDAAYIARLRAASKDNVYAVYLDEKPSYTNSSAFYLDASDILKDKGLPLLALRVLSNLAEMDLENRQILRLLGYRLMEFRAYDMAIPVLEKVLRLAKDEPQSHRDLALAYAANQQYQAAIDQFNQIISGNWDARFRDIAIISLIEMNATIAQAKESQHTLDVSSIDPRLIHNLPLDVRVVMAWDADNSDMDLWVTDPTGDKCYYGRNRTTQGGRMSADVTQGYGPEEFSLRKAMPGKYKIQANFYGNRQQIIAGATTLQVKLFTAFGTAKAKEKTITLRLKDRGDTVYVGEFEVPQSTIEK